MKSGYGINETVTASISGNGQHTELQNAVAYFPEFYYKTYWRLLEYTNGALEFRKTSTVLTIIGHILLRSGIPTEITRSTHGRLIAGLLRECFPQI